ncbi:MAG TPA: PAS domain-containing protein [Smithellaceae bacterium]|nr:PAS domain-containing protein [Smithellaceae bacterium]HRV45320.1 PAS domain-containing protein [Smithellaceae bacterium]
MQKIERNVEADQSAKAAKRLPESAETLLSVLNAVSFLIAYIDREERYGFVNRAYASWYRVRQEDLIGKKVSELLKPDAYERASANIKKALGGQSVWYENQVVDPEGRKRLVSVAYEPFYSGARVVGLVATLTDVTEQKCAAEELKERERQLSSMISNLPGFVYRCANDHDWTMTFISEQCAELTGYRASDFLQNKITYNEIVRPDYREPLREKWQETLRRKDFFEDEYPIIAASGETRWVWERGRGVFDPSGELLFLEGFIWNVTDRKREEQEKEKLRIQLTQAQKMESVGRLAGGIAHDFNNMLSVILGRVDMGMMRVDPAQPLYKDLQEIRKAAERSANLTRQLLAFARKQTVSLKVLDLNETVERMLKILQRLIGEDIEIVWRPGKAPSPVKMDPVQIDQILFNLCVNAKDAIGGVGRIIIETENAIFDDDHCAVHRDFLPGDYATLCVSDNGCGMDAATLDKLFEPFFTTKAVGQGTGLGLSTVYGIVQQHSGFIHVYSEPGKGSTFRIYLPRHLDASAEPAGKESAAAATGTETILLVEDEPAILEMVRIMIRRLGYTVLSAGKPTEAMELARNFTGEIHLLMSDVIMPEMNGRDLARSIASLHPQIRLLFMSGYPANVIARQGVLDEGVHFIQKPFLMKDLAAKLREAVADR